jgi:hypothetical protein
MAGAGRRFVLEAIFLASLAVGVALAGLSTTQIIGVMALGWLVTVLIELVSWRLAVRHPHGVAEPVAAAPAPPPAMPEPQPEPEAAVAPEEPPRRRRGIFRRRVQVEETIVVEEDEVTEPPRHVRLIERQDEGGEDDDTGAGIAGPPAGRAEGA